MKWLYTLVIGAAVLVLAYDAARAQEAPRRWTVEDVLLRLETASPLARCIVKVETGGTYNPYAVGDHGTSLGPTQLHSPGKRDDFYAQEYTDPYSPQESIDFLEAQIAAGNGPAWSAYWWCV